VRRVISILLILLVCTLFFSFRVNPVKALDTIYIRADGSVDPPTAPISTTDNVTYAFTNNIHGSIIIERDNIVVDGDGYTVQGGGNGTGIDLSYRGNVTLKGVKLTNYIQGITLLYSSHNTIIDCVVLNNSVGIQLVYSSRNVLSNSIVSYNMHAGVELHFSSNNILNDNIISDNEDGVLFLTCCCNNNVFGNMVYNHPWSGFLLLNFADNNVFVRNTIVNNKWGIDMYLSGYNMFFHNNLIHNKYQLTMTYHNCEMNMLDDGYPSGGNYWSDYNGTDLYSGPYQNESGRDGIGDIPFVTLNGGKDNFPLMKPYLWWNPADINYDFQVDISDIVLAIDAYDSSPGESKWNPFVDIAPPWNRVDILDLVTIAYHYGEEYTP